MDIEEPKLVIIGKPLSSFKSNSFPTKAETLQRFAYFHCVENKRIRASAQAVIKEIFNIYAANHLCTVTQYNAIAMLENLYKKVQSLKKNYGLPKNVSKMSAFEKDLTEIFDVSKKPSKNVARTPSDFDHAPQKRQRANDIAQQDEPNVDSRTKVKCDVQRAAKNRCINSIVMYDDAAKSSGDEDWLPKRSKKEVSENSKKNVPLEVTTVLDRCALSQRKSHLMLSTISGDASISSATLKRRRDENRTSLAESIKSNFKPFKYPIVHWDGKLLPDFTDGGNGL